jgi:predicted O-methyltransferase YrrM
MQNILNLDNATSFYRYGIEQPHLPVINYCLDNLKFDGLILEFGVWTGISTNFIAKKIAPKVVHAFDSFEGLSESWNNLPKGYFKENVENLKFEPNVHLVIGWYNDTVQKFSIQNKQPASFINIDCDLYSSTKEVLYGLNINIMPGTIIYFDEFYDNGEYKAFKEWIEDTNRKYRAIAYNDVAGIAIEITNR